MSDEPDRREVSPSKLGRDDPEGNRAAGGELMFYQAEDGSISLEVHLDQDTIWLSLNQMAELFERDKSVISRHMRNIFRQGELDRKAVVAFLATTASDGKVYRVEYFNLDAVLSVGYRVNSRRGMQLRVWATRVLRDHVTKGYTVNERRLADLNQAVRLIAGMVERRDLTGDEARALLLVVGEYSFALDLLDDYDHQRVPVPPAGQHVNRHLTYEETLRVVGHLRDRFGGGGLFGLEKDSGLRSALGAIMQTFDGRDVYPTLEEKAAHLLYFVVKSHPFVDGNKRIGAALFLWFLQINDALLERGGERRVSEAALVAVTLLMAESRAEEKDPILRMVTHLLRRPAG